jgi:hypothetical protein
MIVGQVNNGGVNDGKLYCVETYLDDNSRVKNTFRWLKDSLEDVAEYRTAKVINQESKNKDRIYGVWVGKESNEFISGTFVWLDEPSKSCEEAVTGEEAEEEIEQ